MASAKFMRLPVPAYSYIMRSNSAGRKSNGLPGKLSLNDGLRGGGGGGGGGGAADMVA